MKFVVITLFPQMVTQALSYGVIGKAIETGLIEIQTVNPRDYSLDKHQRVDDRPFGGGAGMVMMYDPLAAAIKELQHENFKLSFLTPDGKKLNQEMVNTISKRDELVLLCGRYEGIDQRFIDEFVDEEISLGDFVISGGEIAAATIIDAVARQIPGVLGDEDSAKTDSFMKSQLGFPQYTRSDELGQKDVPEVLLSGNHAKIKEWRSKKSLEKTLNKRPDLLKK